MSVVMVKCGNPLCRSEFGVADPEGVWETDQDLAQGQGWLVDGALVACSGECLTLAQAAASVTSHALLAAAEAAWRAADGKAAKLGASIVYRIACGFRIPGQYVELAQSAIADQIEAVSLSREALAQAGAA